MTFAKNVLVSTLVLAWSMGSSFHADAQAARDTATLLFDNPDWSKAPAGTTITYDYSRKTFGHASYGLNFDDTVSLKLEPGENAASRKVDVTMFTGPHRKPAGPFESMSTNPVLLLMFEEHVQALSQMFQANPRYLKNAIRKAWRDAATIEDRLLTVGDKTVPGTRITIQPFINDPMKDRMVGLEGLTYGVDIADSVPGEIVDIDIRAPRDGARVFSETLHVQSGKTP